MKDVTPPMLLGDDINYIESIRDFNQHIEDGLVHIQFHPTQPLAIANYTKAVLSLAPKDWTPTLSACRGLIFNHKTGEVLSRPYPKFWNLTDQDVIKDREWEVTEKLDGFLGIFWTLLDPGEFRRRYAETAGTHWGVASRGSFTSPHAKWATEWLRKHLDKCFSSVYSYSVPLPNYGTTVLFECLSRQFPVVISYKGEDRLVIHGVLTYNGIDISPLPHFFNLNTVQTYNICPSTVKNMEGIEGFVLREITNGTRPSQRFKVKTQWYMNCVRMMQQLTPRNLLRMRREGIDVRAWVEDSALLKEVKDAAFRVIDYQTLQINASVALLETKLSRLIFETQITFPLSKEDRKRIAGHIIKSTDKELLFLLLTQRNLGLSVKDSYPKVMSALLQRMIETASTKSIMATSEIEEAA